MQNVMKQAWAIARTGQKNFGGKVIEYFAEALRMAWRIVKNPQNKEEKNMKELVGSEKQVQWAEDIRKLVVEHVEDVRIAIEEALNSGRVPHYVAEDYSTDYFMDVINNFIESESSAKVWIEIFKSVTWKNSDKSIANHIIGSMIKNEHELGLEEFAALVLYKAGELV